jgi:hypothetical protein
MGIRSGIILATFFALLSQGCAGGTPPATKTASHPTPIASKARVTPSPRPSLGTPALEAPGWEGVVVRTLCLDAQLSLTDPGIEDAIQGGLEKMLAEWGIEIVGATASCDATLKVTLMGQAHGARYSSGYCYTGGETSGKVTFIGSGRAPIESVIDFSWGTPMIIYSCPRTPRDSSLCSVAARQVFRRVVHLWDLSELAEDPTPGPISSPSYGPLVGGRTWVNAYASWCTSLPPATPKPTATQRETVH